MWQRGAIIWMVLHDTAFSTYTAGSRRRNASVSMIFRTHRWYYQNTSRSKQQNQWKIEMREREREREDEDIEDAIWSWRFTMRWPMHCVNHKFSQIPLQVYKTHTGTPASFIISLRSCFFITEAATPSSVPWSPPIIIQRNECHPCIETAWLSPLWQIPGEGDKSIALLRGLTQLCRTNQCALGA